MSIMIVLAIVMVIAPLRIVCPFVRCRNEDTDVQRSVFNAQTGGPDTI